MKLSMWNLYDYLGAYGPEAHIKTGRMCLRGARILYGDSQKNNATVYLANMEDYFGDRGGHSGVICVHGTDYILFKEQDMELMFNEVLNCFEYYNNWSDECVEMIKRGCSLKELLQYSEAVFENALMLTDAGHMVLYGSKPRTLDITNENEKKALEYLDKVLEDGFMPMKDILTARQMPEIYKLASESYFVMLRDFEVPVLIQNISYDNAVWGYVSEAFYDQKPVKGHAYLLNNLGRLIEFWIEDNWKKASDSSHYVSLFRRLLKQDSPDALTGLEKYMETFGWPRECNKYLLQIESVKNDKGIYASLGGHLNHIEACLSCTYEGRLYLLTNAEEFSREYTLKQIRYILNESKSYAIISPQIQSCRNLADIRKLLQITAQYCRSDPGMIYNCSEHVLQYMFNIFRENCGTVFRHPALEILGAYDRKNGTELRQTLYSYLWNERRYDDTAAQMYIHRNTVKYRIERAVELTGIDLENPDQRMLLLLSYILD